MSDLLEHVKKRVKNNKAQQYLVSAEEYEGLVGIIEQQQAQISECERLHRELATSLRHNAESPSLCDLVAVARAVANERDELAATVERLREALDELQDNSTGVAGLHMNGDIATWDSLRQGGHFESWLMAFDETPSTNLNAVRRESYREGYSSGWKHSLGTKAEDGNHYACGERLAAQLSAQRYPDKE